LHLPWTAECLQPSCKMPPGRWRPFFLRHQAQIFPTQRKHRKEIARLTYCASLLACRRRYSPLENGQCSDYARSSVFQICSDSFCFCQRIYSTELQLYSNPCEIESHHPHVFRSCSKRQGIADGSPRDAFRSFGAFPAIVVSDGGLHDRHAHKRLLEYYLGKSFPVELLELSNRTAKADSPPSAIGGGFCCVE